MTPWSSILESLVGTVVTVLLDGTRSPLLSGMKGTLQKLPFPGFWQLKCRPEKSKDGHVVPGGLLTFTESDLVRVYVPDGDAPDLRIV